VFRGSGLCDELISHPEHFYQLWCVVVHNLDTSSVERPLPALGHNAIGILTGFEFTDMYCLCNVLSSTHTWKSEIKHLYAEIMV